MDREIYPINLLKDVFPMKTKDKQGGIYFIFDKDHKLLYLGRSKNLYKRLYAHFFGEGSTTELTNNTYLFKEFMEYFSFEEIEDYSMEKAKVKERIFIKKYNPIFNKCLNGDEYINDPFYEEWMKKKFHVRIDLGGFEI